VPQLQLLSGWGSNYKPLGRATGGGMVAPVWQDFMRKKAQGGGAAIPPCF